MSKRRKGGEVVSGGVRPGVHRAPFGRECGGSRRGGEPPVSIGEFAARHGCGVMEMEIDPDVSRFPRAIKIPQCPGCGGPLYLSHPLTRPDPYIEAKRTDGPLRDLVPPDNKWLSSCWTAECDFFIALKLSDLYPCPVCGRHCMEGYTLFDHMSYQCTEEAARPEALRRAGVDGYAEVAQLGGRK